MTLHRPMGFYTRPHSVDSTAATIVIGSSFVATLLLAMLLPNPRELSNNKSLALVTSPAVLPLDARQCHFDVAGQGLPDDFSIEGAQVMSDAAQEVPVRSH
jgi:hypothetical protein